MELAKEENCSLNTVQRAVQELKKEGVLMIKTGQ
jgi:DNA-binding transcriptional regulator YhcF (GntR family)